MPSPVTKSIVVPVVADIEPLVWQMIVIKDLLVELSESLDSAIQALQEMRNHA